MLYHYDTAPSDLPPGLTLTPAFLKGRLIAVSDRASYTVTSYDGRGRTTDTASRIAKPGTPSDLLAQRYTPRWYEKSMLFDAADREVVATTGATSAELQGVVETQSGSTTAVTIEYSRRGTVKSAGGSYGVLVAAIDRDADALLNEIIFGDAAQTTTGFSYDQRRRLSSVQTYRGPPAHWTSPPANYVPAPTFGPDHQPTFQLLLQDDELTYDVVSNPTEIHDWRIADEWPAGAKPVTKKVEYDDLYRVARIDYQYAAGDDTWVSPFAPENSNQPDLQDGRRADPSPHVNFDKRLLWQTYAYDWLGNTSETEDDARGFYDRSLGTITNDPPASKPYQLKSASNKTGAPSTRNGALATAYDACGNLTRMHLERNGPCLPSAAQCSQVFSYNWDEVGRLIRARRWDVAASTVGAPSDPLPNSAPAVTLHHAYDAGDQRVIKTAVDPALAESHTVYIFDSLELRGAAWVAAGGLADDFDYELSRWTEVPYLFANGVRLARLAYEEPDVPSIASQHLHVFFELGDHLGSTSVVLDKATGELVERATYQAYGSAESDYRPDRWKGFREDYRFTGKEDDVEVGLQYFGKRFLSAHLQRWISADPLPIHSPGQGDPNVYAYVRGSPLQNVDPLGLQDKKAQSDPPAAGQTKSDTALVGAALQHHGVTPDKAPVIDCRNGCGGLEKLAAPISKYEGLSHPISVESAPSRKQRSAAALKGVASTGVDVAKAATVAVSVPFGPMATVGAPRPFRRPREAPPQTRLPPNASSRLLTKSRGLN